MFGVSNWVISKEIFFIYLYVGFVKSKYFLFMWWYCEIKSWIPTCDLEKKVFKFYV